MPHIIVKLYPGRSEEQKQKLANAIAEQVVSIAQCKPTSVSVAIEDVDPEHWAEQVYQPEVLDKSHQLYIKPGYNPFES